MSSQTSLVLKTLLQKQTNKKKDHKNWKWKSLSPVWLCDPRDYTDHGILQARILEWVALPFSRGASQPRDQTQGSHKDWCDAVRAGRGLLSQNELWNGTKFPFHLNKVHLNHPWKSNDDTSFKIPQEKDIMQTSFVLVAVPQRCKPHLIAQCVQKWGE